MKAALALVLVVACGHDSDDATPDAAIADPPDAATDAPAATVTRTLGTVTNVRDAACPGAPAHSTCQQITVTGCPELATEDLDAIIAIVEPTAPLAGTIVHFKGGGGEGYQESSTAGYAAAGYRQVFVSWTADWELTASPGIKAAACRPATVIAWVFDTIHQASRDVAFCGEGFSGGSAQLGYALSHYGLADRLDYVNELSGPPFARLDLGCDGDAPPTTTVCGATVTMQLRAEVTPWETAPLACPSTNVPASDLARWKADSIAVGGVYDFPNTRVEFFACTEQASAVTGMGQLYYNAIVDAEATDGAAYHCYTQADGCHGEGLGQGSADAVAAMIQGCMPHHR